MTTRYLVMDVFDGLATLEDGSVDLVISSPPFLALRSYLPADHPDKSKEIGSESTPAEFLDVMLRFTAELRRVLAPHGSIAIELGDTYAGQQPTQLGEFTDEWAAKYAKRSKVRADGLIGEHRRVGDGWPLAKSKTLIPELYRIALAYGINPLTGAASPAGQWRIRNVVTWARPNPPVGALGDKWRPATSDVVVACLSGKRYWDDLATRRAFAESTLRREEGPPREMWREGRKDNTEALTHAEYRLTHSGAPLLDYWEIPPGGYTGSHYAVFPPELVVPLVKAMCPERVCRTCGEPSRRVIETEYSDGAVRGFTSDNGTGRGGHQGIPTAHRIDQTTGWTDCGHGSIVCRSCSALVPYDHNAIQRSRRSTSVQGGVGEAEVLGEPGEGADGQAQASADMRSLRSGIPGENRNVSNLQPVLFGEVGTHGRADESDRWPGPGESDLEWRTEGKPSGLRPDMGAAGVSGSTEERLHDGASSGDAGTSRSDLGSLGVGSPQERDQGRQPDRESGDSEPREAGGSGDLSQLPDGVSDALDGWVCQCGSSELKYVADHWRPGLILDPFAGSGTTLLVATGHGHDAIGIDLDSRNAELALERVGPFLLEVETP